MLVFKREGADLPSRTYAGSKDYLGVCVGGVVEETGSQETEKFKFCFGSP